MEDRPCLAIDFGTTRTKVAWFDPDRGEPRLIELGTSQRETIPSVFYIPKQGHGEILVGDEAMAQIDSDPVGLVCEIKREIDKIGKKRCGLGRLTPTRVELATALLSTIRQRCECEVFHGTVIDRCALTVPVAFTEQQRNKLTEAAKAAGFREIRLIDEPTAAARAWVEEEGNRLADNVVVCDIGGGTTDFSLVSWFRDGFSAHPDVPPAGFAQGGNDIDDAAFSQLMDRQEEEVFSRFAQMRDSLLIRMRAVKEQLSRGLRHLKLTADGTAVEVPEDVFDAAVAEFSNRLGDELERFLGQCRSCGIEAPAVVLVGGSSRISELKERVEQLAPGRTYSWSRADYATVLGAVEFPERAGGFSSAKQRQARAAYTESLRAVCANKAVTITGGTFLSCRREELEIGEAEAAVIEETVLGCPLSELALVDETAPHTSFADAEVLETAEKLIAGQKLDEAANHLQMAICADTNVSEYFSLMAKLKWQQRQWELACSAATAAIRLHPEDYDTLLLRGKCNLLANRGADARGDMSRVRACSPEHFDESSYHLATSFYRSGEWALAAACLSEMFPCAARNTGGQHVPPAVPAMLLGLIALREQRCEEAKGYLSKAMEWTAAGSDRDASEAGGLVWCFSPDSLHRCDQQIPHLQSLPRGSLAFLAPMATACPRCGLAYRYDGAVCHHCSGAEKPHSGWLNFLPIVDSSPAAAGHAGSKDALLDAIEQPLFDACAGCQPGVAQAVRDFDRIVRPLGRTLVGLTRFCSQEHLIQATVVAAEHAGPNHPEHEVSQLVRRLISDREFDVSVLQCEPAVISLRETREFLTPRLAAKADWGSVFNSLTVTNESSFTVTAVQVVATIIRADGSHQWITKRTSALLEPGKTHHWKGIFDDPGFLGANIRNVHLIATCAQSLPAP